MAAFTRSVNVILVDSVSDTLGEATVLVIVSCLGIAASFTVLSLSTLSSHRHLALKRVGRCCYVSFAAGLLLTLTLLLAAYIFLRGHNLPVAGLSLDW